MKCEIANETRTGKRPYNQDRMGFWQTDHALLLVLADGMGGHAHGALAAELTLRFMANAFRRAALPRLADPDLFLFRSIGRAQAMLCAHARDHGLDETPRTTIVACVVQDGCAYWTHVGDSRLYLIRRGEVLARTRDQTFVQELVERGRISEAQAQSHPQRHVLLQCLGGPLPPRVDPASMARLERGDMLLLSSDGFHGPLAAHEIGQGLAAASLQDSLHALSSEAESRAGAQCDNLTALVLAWQEDAPQAASAETDYLSLSDADIEREIEKLRQAFRACSAPAPADEYMSDEEIEREIERIRHAFRAGA